MDKKIREIIKQFTAFACNELRIKQPCPINTSINRELFTTHAFYNHKEKEVSVYIKNRQICDVLRSIAHELVHHMQNENNKLTGQIQDIGGPIEDEANSKAGQIVKKFTYEYKDKNKIDLYSI
jgi:hypothetical protein